MALTETWIWAKCEDVGVAATKLSGKIVGRGIVLIHATKLLTLILLAFTYSSPAPTLSAQHLHPALYPLPNPNPRTSAFYH